MWNQITFIQVEANYSRWQLMDKPISLGMFNILPHLTPAFFEYSLRLEQYRWDHPFMKFEFGSFLSTFDSWDTVLGVGAHKWLARGCENYVSKLRQKW